MIFIPYYMHLNVNVPKKSLGGSHPVKGLDALWLYDFMTHLQRPKLGGNL